MVKIDRILNKFNLHDKLLTNAVFLFGTTAVNGGAGLIFWLFATRLFDVSEIGISSSILSLIQFLGSLASLGLGMGLVMFLPKEENKTGLINSVYIVILSAGFIIGSIFVIGIFLFNFSISQYFSSIWLICGFIVFLMVRSFSNIINQSFLAFRNTQYGFWKDVLVNLLRIGLIFLLVGYGRIGILGSIFISILIGTLVGYIIFLPRVFQSYRVRFSKFSTKISTVVSYSFGNYIANFLNGVPMLLVTPMTLEFIGQEASAYVYVSWMILTLLIGPGIALANSAMAEGSHSPQALKNILIRAGVYSLGITLLLSLIAYVGAEAILNIFGEGYVFNSSDLLRLLAISGPFVVINWIFFTTLRLRKRIKELIFSTLVLAIIAVGIPFVFLAKFGILTSGYGWLAAQIISLIVLVNFVRRDFKVMW